MRIVFFGTPEYVLPVLEKLNKSFRTKGISPVVAVVTQGPKPAGRKKLLAYSPVDNWAHKRNAKINNPSAKIEILHSAKELKSQGVQADIGILAAYGEIIPSDVLKMFPLGILNIHPSLLPKFRGASPVQATIATEEQAGATIIKLDEEMDHGPIVAQFKDETLATDTTETLRDRLFARATDVLVELLPAYISGKITPKEQDHTSATYTKLITKQDGFIPWGAIGATFKGRTFKGEFELSFIKNFSTSYSPNTIHRFVRAMHPWPGIWTEVDIKSQKTRLKILKTHLDNEKLVIDEVQLEGKKPVTWKQFKEAYL